MRNFQNKAIQSIGIYSQRSWEGSVWANTDIVLNKKKQLAEENTYIHWYDTLIQIICCSVCLTAILPRNLHFLIKTVTAVDCVVLGKVGISSRKGLLIQIQRQRWETGRYELCCRTETLWDKHSYRKCKLDESPLLLAHIRTTHFR